MFSLQQMTLRKKTIYNSVGCIPEIEQTREFKQNTINNNSLLKKQNKNISQNNKKILKDVAAQGFGLLKK